MKRFLVLSAACVMLAMTVAACDKLKPPMPLPLPKTEAPPSAQEPNASAPAR